MQLIPLASLSASLPPRWASTSSSPAAHADVPIEVAILRERAASDYVHTPGAIFTLPGLPFPHAVCMLGGDVLEVSHEDAGARLHGFYKRLLAHVSGEGARGFQPHNVLLTRTWMLVVPRAQATAFAEHVPSNALVFAGLLLEQTAGHVAAIAREGPMRVLSVSVLGGAAGGPGGGLS